jgi:hypothetical protein
LNYINDIPKIINNKSKPVLFADDTSIIGTNPSPVDFKNDIITVFEHTNKWFKANLLSLNFDKTHYIQFITKNISFIDINIG